MKITLCILLSLMALSFLSQNSAPVQVSQTAVSTNSQEVKTYSKNELLHGSRNAMHHGMTLGISFFLFIYNFLLFISIRDRSTLYFSIFMLLNCITEVSIKYQYFELLNGVFPWVDYLSHQTGIADFLMCFQFIFYILFAKTLLNITPDLKTLNRLMTLLLVFFIGLSVYFFIQLKGKMNDKPLNLTGSFTIYSFMLSLVTIFIIGVTRWLKNYKPARIFVLANLVLYIGMLLSGLSMVNIIKFEPKLFGIDLTELGFFIFILILAFSIGDKINLLKKEKIEAQEKALEILEEKVKERTAEVVLQKKIIEDKNKDIMDSMHYAKRIQISLLPTQKFLERVLNRTNKTRK